MQVDKIIICSNSYPEILQDLKKHPCFADLNWELILNKKITPPMEMVDVREEYNLKEKEKVDLIDEDYNKDNANLKRIPGFSFIKKDI